jgi:hypothetical protein
MGMTYSEKLKDARWLDFRREFIERRRIRRHGQDFCDECGEETRGPLHVHHRLYLPNKEPWQYEDEQLRLLCEECHELIHATEEQARNLIRRLPAHVCEVFGCLLDELEKCEQLGPYVVKVALAHCKNEARTVYWAEKNHDPSAPLVNCLQTMAEMEKDYVARIEARRAE